MATSGGDCPSTGVRNSILTCWGAFAIGLQGTSMYFSVSSITSTAATGTSLCSQSPVRWVNVAGVFGSSQLKLFVNATLDGTAGTTSSSSRAMGNTAQLCYLGNDGYNYGLPAQIRHMYIRSVASTAEGQESGMHNVQAYSSDLLVYLAMDDGSVADKYKAKVNYTANSVFALGKSNAPEFVCYCTGKHG